MKAGMPIFNNGSCGNSFLFIQLFARSIFSVKRLSGLKIIYQSKKREGGSLLVSETVNNSE